jgi:hypothetical protein
VLPLPPFGAWATEEPPLVAGVGVVVDVVPPPSAGSPAGVDPLPLAPLLPLPAGVEPPCPPWPEPWLVDRTGWPAPLEPEPVPEPVPLPVGLPPVLDPYPVRATTIPLLPVGADPGWLLLWCAGRELC